MKGQKTPIKKVVVVPYSTTWATEFGKLKMIFSGQLQDLILRIEHVGSTAVPGLAAKPIIDIDLIINNKYKFDHIIEILSKLGYTHGGEMGIPGREAFTRNSALTPEDGSGNFWPQHHLYVCLENSNSLRNHLIFRDYLRNNPKKVKEYSELKLKLAKNHTFDIDGYVEAKTTFILSILENSGFDQEDLSTIKIQNKAINKKQ
ncbi:GrpB family protein [Pedobacter sp. PAMC26386]|nr:GrpB family protein [Pedobacter sp. PAMC26386]